MYMEESRRGVEVYLGRGLGFEATVAIWRQVQLFIDWYTCYALGMGFEFVACCHGCPGLARIADPNQALDMSRNFLLTTS